MLCLLYLRLAGPHPRSLRLDSLRSLAAAADAADTAPDNIRRQSGPALLAGNHPIELLTVAVGHFDRPAQLALTAARLAGQDVLLERLAPDDLARARALEPLRGSPMCFQFRHDSLLLYNFPALLFRRLWVVRINAAARENGLTYGQLIAGLKAAGNPIDRKTLADLAVTSPKAFTVLAKAAADAKPAARA